MGTDCVGNRGFFLALLPGWGLLVQGLPLNLCKKKPCHLPYPKQSLTPAPTQVYMQRRSLVTPMSEPETTIFLTFDDGPTPGVTDRIAQILAGYKIEPAFVVGRNARSPQNRAILARLAAKASHRQPYLRAQQRYLSEAEFEALYAAQQCYWQTFCRNRVKFSSVRPVASGIGCVALGLIARCRRPRYRVYLYGPIFWNAGGVITQSGSSLSNAADWQCWAQQISVALCAQGYLAKIRANAAAGKPSVVLMHDLSGQSAELLEQVIEGLLQDSNTYQFKRLDRASWPSGWPGL